VRSREHAGASGTRSSPAACPESAPSPSTASPYCPRPGEAAASRPAEFDGRSLVSRKTKMLRIERSVKDALVVFTMSGRVGMEHIPELQRVLDSEAENRKALDLKDVRLVDRDAVRFLARCEAGGTALENCPIYIRQWIVREAALT